MSLRVVGAGVGRTGTQSLKLALERLLGGRCYHNLETNGRPDDIRTWHAAARGSPVDWGAMLTDYVACVDWPAASFWRELSDANPEAVVLLSVRDAEAWWRSADRTIFEVLRKPSPPENNEWRAMWDELMRRRFTDRLDDKEAAIAAYEHHNDEVRAGIAAERLVEWHPEDGWPPLCTALGLPVPDEPFPHVNTTQGFRLMVQRAAK